MAPKDWMSVEHPWLSEEVISRAKEGKVNLFLREPQLVGSAQGWGLKYATPQRSL